jgi:hypothetical protein
MLVFSGNLTGRKFSGKASVQVFLFHRSQTKNLCNAQKLSYLLYLFLRLYLIIIAMKTEYFLQVLCMLQAQLKEEEESYRSSLASKKEPYKLKDIKQRIKALRHSINSINFKIRESTITSDVVIKKEVLFLN